MPHAYHTVSDMYAAGVYSYLWADVMAADVAAAFSAAPGGMYDSATAERYFRCILSVGASVPAEEAFRNFSGRDPDPGALLRRYGLEVRE
jgi:Zn-dependent oligopeptidase